MAIKRVHQAALKVDVVVAKDFLSLEQLNAHIRRHICDHVVKVLKISAADLSKRSREIFQRGSYELKRFAENHVFVQFDLEILLHVLTNNFDLAVRSLFELEND